MLTEQDDPLFLSGDEQHEHSKRLHKLIRELVYVVIAANRMAKQEYGEEAGTTAVLDALFTLVVDFGRCHLNLGKPEMEILGNIFQIMASKYPDVVTSTKEWAALTPFHYVNEVRKSARTVN